jgi:hypothetical protein
MRTSVEIPDAMFRDLKLLAAHRGVTLKALICEAIQKEIHGKSAPGYRVTTPLVPRKGRGKIDLTNAEIEELLT